MLHQEHSLSQHENDIIDRIMENENYNTKNTNGKLCEHNIKEHSEDLQQVRFPVDPMQQMPNQSQTLSPLVDIIKESDECDSSS